MGVDRNLPAPAASIGTRKRPTVPAIPQFDGRLAGRPAGDPVDQRRRDLGPRPSGPARPARAARPPSPRCRRRAAGRSGASGPPRPRRAAARGWSGSSTPARGPPSARRRRPARREPRRRRRDATTGHACATGKPRLSLIASARARRPPRIQSATTPSLMSGRRVQRHIGDVDPGAAELERELGDHAGPVRDRDAQLAEVAARELRLQQPPAIARGVVVPGGDRVGVAPLERVADLLQAPDGVVELLDQRIAVAEGRCRSRSRSGRPRRGSRRGSSGRSPAGARRRRRAPPRPGARARWRARAAGARRARAVASWVSARSRSAGRRAHQQAMEALVQDAAGPRGRGQVPGGALEQVGAGVRDPGRLGAGERVAADEPLVGGRGDDRALGRADVGHDTAAGRVPSDLPDERRQQPDGHGDEHHVRVGDGRGERVARGSTAPSSSAAASARGVGVPAPDSAPSTLARGERDRAADQAEADDRDPHPRRARLRARGHRPGEPVEHRDGGVPTDAAVSDRLTVGERLNGCPRRGPAGRRPGTTRSSRPTIARLPAAICLPTASATAGWRSGCLPQLSCERSIITRYGNSEARSSSVAMRRARGRSWACRGRHAG